MSLIARVISATLCNSLRWSRSRCNFWDVRWPVGITDSVNIGGYQWSRLLRPFCSWREGLILKWWHSQDSGQWILQNDGRPRGCWFLGRSVLKNSWVMFSERSPAWRNLFVCLWEFLMRWDMCLSPGVGQKLTTTRIKKILTSILSYGVINW